ncbi:MAG: zinc ribbon domain-containing protein [Parvibaculum sp.]|uniref:zinc ribbon domain-containing protein n=1 Tax=Parvibaculum sp. TaxID=2024848 RepID=UPI0027321089|nr:zinc ribbon domain-containing protein [Parvibaculum sp.]MDP2151207.1 zinc ribbon domain-containing protein [Parvibaculum sp.]
MGDILAPILESPGFILVRQLSTLFFVIFWFALTFWAYRDAYRRGAMAWFWGLVVFMFNVAGWAIYLVVRPPEYAADARERELEIRSKEVALQRDLETCPACYKPVEKDFLICPYCMKKLRKPCIECDQALKLNWNVCPYCKTKQ